MKATDQQQQQQQQQPREDKPLEDLPSRNGNSRRRIYWGTAIGAAVLVIAVVAAILGLVVFRIRYPTLSVNCLKIQAVNFYYDAASQKIRLNATLELCISVRNPNRASFKFGNGSTLVYHAGTRVGTGVVPAGKIPARRTVNLTSIVTIVGDGLVPNASRLAEALPGSLNFSASTVMSGRVNVMNIYKHHAVSRTSCNLTVKISEQKVESQRCMYSLKL